MIKYPNSNASLFPKCSLYDFILSFFPIRMGSGSVIILPHLKLEYTILLFKFKNVY